VTTHSFDLDATFWELDDDEQLAALGIGRVEPDRRHRAKVRQAVAELVEDASLQEHFATSYTPSRYEESWLPASLGPFIEDALITDVQAMIKGGKEACVYRCAAHASLGVPYLAAKVYRPRQFRNLRNDALYREGRSMLVPSGSEIKPTDGRVRRAIRKKTSFGREVLHLSWMTHEYDAMKRLHALGGDVPEPVAVGGNAILMGYIGGSDRAAPTLHEADIPANVAPALRDRALHNAELLLRADLVHGDLSAFNILYWEGELALIDFPQVVDALRNPQAKELLRRDLERLDGYFAVRGAPIDVNGTVDAWWEQYIGARALSVPADLLAEDAMDDESAFRSP
jgi:RIO kinase 1